MYNLSKFCSTNMGSSESSYVTENMNIGSFLILFLFFNLNLYFLFMRSCRDAKFQPRISHAKTFQRSFLKDKDKFLNLLLGEDSQFIRS